jgi:hypothetical protein
MDEHEDSFQLTLVFIGREAINRSLYSLVAMEQAAEEPRWSFRVELVTTGGNGCSELVWSTQSSEILREITPEQLAPQAAGREISIRTRSPLRLYIKKRPSLALSFKDLILANARRVSSLEYWYGGGGRSRLPDRALELADSVQTTRERWEWQEQSFFSRKQGRSVGLGGLSGHARFEGSIAPFQQLLTLGTVLGIGKATGYGLGLIEQYVDTSS